jgi:hypothetical protein
MLKAKDSKEPQKPEAPKKPLAAPAVVKSNPIKREDF